MSTIRAIINALPDFQPQVVQASDYYPFGMIFQTKQMQAAQGDNANP